MNDEIICPTCHLAFRLHADGAVAQYCPYCRSALLPGKATTIPHHTQSEQTPSLKAPSVSVSFLPEHLPSADGVQFVIGPYQVIKSIGKGGMGEVFLAYDTTCGRRLAIKKIRPDLLSHQGLHNRFLKEARITSQLTHPAIIPIYAIHSEGELTYYTMPYVEGSTLKQILKEARQQEKNGEKVDSLAGSIPALIRIFLSICQAVAYAHSKQVLHRDLKPENIIVGQYGQIVILDWGLAKIANAERDPLRESELDDTDELSLSSHHMTRVGKVVGTVSYMAPERAKGEPATFQTDIYSLGVILYQMLTLRHPFQRPSLKEFRENLSKETLIDPLEVAPYRDVPKSLSQVVIKCLNFDPSLRYSTVDSLIHDLENYIEGRSEWFQTAQLDMHTKADWEFQENVLLPEHIALTRNHETFNWVSMMVSKASFPQNIRLEAILKIGEKGHGIGFLLSIPESAERTLINDGYCLWVGSDSTRSTKLFRSSVEVMTNPDVHLKHGVWHKVVIEKVDNNIHFYLDGEKQFSYISHLPVAGTHIGLLSSDADFSIKNFFVSVGSQNITVKCLAVPDAFLAHKEYVSALNEYRRIGYSFPGRAEGREAMFRAGITLLEQANNTSDTKEKHHLLDLALEEFHRLYNTPGAPLEYLGKALVYNALNDIEEEVKCFELALRRYPRHPLLPILQEQIIYRMYASSQRGARGAMYNFILLMLRFLPDVAGSSNTQKLLLNLEKSSEPLFFIQQDPHSPGSASMRHFFLILKLAFWLARPQVIEEMIDELKVLPKIPAVAYASAVMCLIELGAFQEAQQKLDQLGEVVDPVMHEIKEMNEWLKIALTAHLQTLDSALSLFMEKSSKGESFIYHDRLKNSHLGSVKAPAVERSEKGQYYNTDPFPIDSTPGLSRSPNVNFPTDRGISLAVLFHLIQCCLDAKNTDAALTLCQSIDRTILPSETALILNELTIFALLQKKEWEGASKILSEYPLELLSQDSTLLHFLYGCLLFVTEGKEIATIHFSGVFEVPFPKSWNLFSYYLRGDLFEPHGWFSKAFMWEKKALFRQLALYYSCINEEAKADEYQKRIASPTPPSQQWP